MSKLWTLTWEMVIIYNNLHQQDHPIATTISHKLHSRLTEHHVIIIFIFLPK